jgi:GrpB-like predicted nucleotidyltransferase (UPF0157 family)
MLVVPYDPLWPHEFDAEADRIERAWVGLPIQLEHMGSTSVPGLSAKPVIDILAGVPWRAKREPYVAAMRSLGYDHVGAYGLPGRDYFRRGSPRTHHVHLVDESSALWADWLMFRDFLRASPETAREYDALKRELALTFADEKNKYQDAKGPFIQSVLRRARVSRS